jgi:hypothetical protein
MIPNGETRSTRWRESKSIEKPDPTGISLNSNPCLQTRVPRLDWRNIPISLTTPAARPTRQFARLPWGSHPARWNPENQRQADFFCGKLNGITFPYSSGGIHFVAFLLNLLGTKNSMIFAINHPTCKNKTEAKKFSF